MSKNITLNDISEIKTVEVIDIVIMDLELARNSIKADIEYEKIQEEETKEYEDKEWLVRAGIALRTKNFLYNAAVKRRSEIKKELMPKKNLPGCFMDTAKEVLPTDTFELIKDRAYKMWEMER